MALKNLFGKKNKGDWDAGDDVLGSSDDTITAAPTLDPADQEAITDISIRARAYREYNERKVATILAKLNDLDKQILTILPSLVHLNRPGIPGYVDEPEKVPDGVLDFKPEDDIPRQIERLLPAAKIAQDDFVNRTSSCPIYSLSAMGSLATIAQTSKSDFDIWVCVNKPDFTPDRLEGLAFKLEEVEKWTETKHFESHFFITDIQEARNNKFGESDEESAGSALGKLLKEEFFRTHTVLAGVAPLWTAMPPHITDEEYVRLSQLAFDNYTINSRSYFDLGNAQRISIEEGFGAALWQLNKALGSPFKSAMKMGLIEDYMDPKSASTLLCDVLKENITKISKEVRTKGGLSFGSTSDTQNESETDSLGQGQQIDDHSNRFDLDGYLLMFNRILEFYGRMDRTDLVEILRQCFYLKAGDTITGINDPMRTRNRKKDMLAELIKGWDWKNEYILTLNNFKDWPFDQSVKLGNQVNNFIIESYKRLSQAGATSSAMINETDLTVLGRKLFTFYSKKEKKVEYLPKTFEDSLHQDQITFTMIPSRGSGDNLWKVYRGPVSAADLQSEKIERNLLRQTRNLPELLTWLVTNIVWDQRTQVNLQSRESRLTAANIQDMLDSLGKYFPPINVGHLPNDDLVKDSQVIKAYAIINLGESHGEKINRIDLIYRTSWGELYTERPPKNVNKMEAIRFCLDRMPLGNKGKKVTLKVYVPSAKTGMATNKKIFTDFENELQGISNFFQDNPLPPLTQRIFLFRGEQGLISVSWDGKEIQTKQHTSFANFFQKGERGRLIRTEIGVAASTTDLLVEQAITNTLKLNTIQVMMFSDGVRSRVYVSDEMGGTMYVSMGKNEWATYSLRLGVFLSNVVKKITNEPWRVKAKMPPVNLSFCTFEAGGTTPNHYEAIENSPKLLRSVEQKKNEPGHLSFSEMKSKEGKRALVFQIDGAKVTSLQHGAKVFEEAVRLFLQSQPKATSIAISDLSIPLDFRKKNCPRGAKTFHFLAYKNMLERKLNDTLKALR